VKVLKNRRRVSHAAYLAGLATLCSTGCSTQSFSMASLNPFSSKPSAEVAATTPAPSKPTGQIASMREAVTGQANNLGMATTSAWSKTKNGVTGMFGGSSEASKTDTPKIAEDDPTRLATPASVSPEVFVAQGALWESTNDFPKAMDSYNRAIQAEPGNAAALASVARLHMRQQNYPLASESFEKAIKASPKDAALLNDYGMARAKMGDTAGASEAIKQALVISPGTSRFANNLANVRFDAGDQEGAMSVLMQHNKPAVAHFNMAYLQYQAGNYAEAKNQLSEVLKFEPAAEQDTAVAQAVSRSRDMLATIDGSATRIAQAGSGVLSTASQISGSFGGQKNTTTQATSVSQPSYAAPPTSGNWSPTAAPVGTPAPTAPQASAPTAAAASGGAFVLPPGVFDQPIR